jgi:hypothetical protein
MIAAIQRLQELPHINRRVSYLGFTCVVQCSIPPRRPPCQGLAALRDFRAAYVGSGSKPEPLLDGRMSASAGCRHSPVLRCKDQRATGLSARVAASHPTSRLQGGGYRLAAPILRSHGAALAACQDETAMGVARYHAPSSTTRSAAGLAGFLTLIQLLNACALRTVLSCQLN